MTAVRNRSHVDGHVAPIGLQSGNVGRMAPQNSKDIIYHDAPSLSMNMRHQAIIQEVNERGFVAITDLAQQFSVSDMSIRRDASVLEQHGLVRRVRGGLLRIDMNLEEAGDFPSRDQANVEVKKRIAAIGASFIGDNDVLAVDAGTTGFQLVRALPPSFCGTVISHSLPVLNYLLDYPQINAIGLGGDVYTRSRAFVGSQTVKACRDLRATIFFMGAAAVSADGIFAAWNIEKDIKQALIEISGRVIVLVDSKKFEAKAPVFLTGWNDRFSLVSDEVPANVQRELAKAGVELSLA